MSDRPKVWRGWSYEGSLTGDYYVGPTPCGSTARPCIVQDLPEGCPEVFPLPGTEIVKSRNKGDYRGTVVSLPYFGTSEEWCVATYRDGQASSRQIKSLDWADKPKLKRRYRIEVEATNRATAGEIIRGTLASCRGVCELREVLDSEK